MRRPSSASQVMNRLITWCAKLGRTTRSFTTMRPASFKIRSASLRSDKLLRESSLSCSIRKIPLRKLSRSWGSASSMNSSTSWLTPSWTWKGSPSRFYVLRPPKRPRKLRSPHLWRCCVKWPRRTSTRLDRYQIWSIWCLKLTNGILRNSWKIVASRFYCKFLRD